jgi:uncharacterized membrane protein
VHLQPARHDLDVGLHVLRVPDLTMVAREARGPGWEGALIGAGAAVLGSIVGNKLRAAAVKASGLPDPFVAIVEDAIALGMTLMAA